jgi:hypothetical protein
MLYVVFVQVSFVRAWLDDAHHAKEKAVVGVFWNAGHVENSVVSALDV